MSEKFSDVVIIGTDLAGLITGAFLAKRGLNITVLNFEKDVSTEKKNIQPNLITHLESRLFKNILGRLSILDHELNVLRKLDVPYQVVLPKHRVDIFQDREKFFRELKREFPVDAENLKTFYSNLDHFEATLDTESLQELILPHGLRKRWRFNKFVKEHGLNARLSQFVNPMGDNRSLQAFFEAQLQFLSNTYSENPFTYPIAKVLSNDNGVLFEVRGGIGHLKKLFLEKIEAFNGKVKNEVQVEEVVFEKRQVKGVKLGGFEGMVGCRYLLWNEEIHRLKKFLPKSFWNRRFLKKIEAIKPKSYHFSIQYRLDPGVIPVGMRENLLLISDPEAELNGPNFLHLHLDQTYRENPQEGAILTVSYLLPVEKLNEPSENFIAVHEEITKRLHSLMPFSEGRLQLTFPVPYREPEADPGMLFSLEKSDFEIFRENATENPIYQLTPEVFGDLFPISNRTLYRNLHLTAPEILAALGFEGKFLLGLKTIEMIWKEVEVTQKKAIRQRKIA